MSLHKAEQIMVAVLAKITGLTTTTTNAYRGRVYPLQATQLPALVLYMGADTPTLLHSQTLMDCALNITVEVVIKTTVQLDMLLNLIRKEVSTALQADYTQGLSFILNTEEGSADDPELMGDSDQPIARHRLHWIVSYRRSRSDPSA